jgi:hypothetical protein
VGQDQVQIQVQVTLVQVTLADDEADWLTAQAAALGLTPEALVIRMVAEERCAVERLRSLIVAGPASGDCQPADEVTARLRARVFAGAG